MKLNPKRIKRKQKAMSDTRDFAVMTAVVPTVGQLNKKPPHLLMLEDSSGKTKVVKKFVSLDRPEILNNFPPSLCVLFQTFSLAKVHGVLMPIK